MVIFVAYLLWRSRLAWAFAADRFLPSSLVQPQSRYGTPHRVLIPSVAVYTSAPHCWMLKQQLDWSRKNCYPRVDMLGQRFSTPLKRPGVPNPQSAWMAATLPFCPRRGET